MDKLQEIWNMQEKFDELVLKNTNTTREETITERQVALFTEVGELANEIQSFKFWKKNKKIDINKIKEEYVDVFHFIISIGIDIFEDANDMYEWYKAKNLKNIRRQEDKH